MSNITNVTDKKEICLIKMDIKPKICRICMVQKKKLSYVDIFANTITTGNTELYLYDAIQELTTVKIKKGDGFPEVICSNCVVRLHQAYELKLQTEQSAERFGSTCSAKELPQKRTIIERKEYYSFQNIKSLGQEVDAVSFICDQLPNFPTSSDSLESKSTLLTSLTSDKSLDKSDYVKQEHIKVKRPIEYEERKHKCLVCEKKFQRKSNLIDHLRLHVNQRPFKCEYCDKSFVQSGNYKSHLRIHTKERPFVCNICHKSYNQSSALKIHFRIHTNERNFGCDVCGKKFTNSSDLKKHKGTHDAVKKFQCTHCEKSFAQKNNLKNHVFSIHSTCL